MWKNKQSEEKSLRISSLLEYISEKKKKEINNWLYVNFLFDIVLLENWLIII